MLRLSLAKLHPHLARVGIDRFLNSLTINFQQIIQLSDAYTNYYRSTTTTYASNYLWAWFLSTFGIIVVISLLLLCLSYACKRHNRSHVLVHPRTTSTISLDSRPNMPPPYIRGLRHPRGFATTSFATHTSGMAAAPPPLELYPNEPPPSYERWDSGPGAHQIFSPPAQTTVP